MRVALSALSLALAVTQGQAQGLSTYLPSHAFGVSKASWWLSPKVVAAASAAGSYGLRSLVTAFQSSPNIEGHPTNKLDYHWEEAVPLRLCSEKTFQLSELPSEAGSPLAVGEPQLQEQGGYCADVIPQVPEGEASLYFNSDDGQIDLNRSTLTVNGQPTPLAQLKPVLADTPVQGNHLALSSGIIEGLDPSLSTPVRLNGSHPVGRQVPTGKQSGGGGGGTPPPTCEETTGGGGATGGAVGGGSGTGGGGASAGGNGDDPRKPTGTDAKKERIDFVVKVVEEGAEMVKKLLAQEIKKRHAGEMEEHPGLGAAGEILSIVRQIIPQVAEQLAKTYSLGGAEKEIIKQEMSRSWGV